MMGYSLNQSEIFIDFLCRSKTAQALLLEQGDL